jgi:hypothetical protein
MKNLISIFVCIALAAIVLISCDGNRVYEEYTEIPDNIWNNKTK